MTAEPLLIDHHCHGLVTDDLDRAGFEALLNEASGPSPMATTLFDSLLGLAVRRWCAPVLDLEPHASPEAYLDRRRDLGADAVNRRFLAAAGLSDLIVDTGFGGGRLTDPAQTAAYGGARGHEIVRLETVAEDLLTQGVAPGDLAERVVREITSRGAVGAKSIAAYRTGLALAPVKPTDAELVSAASELRPAAASGSRTLSSTPGSRTPPSSKGCRCSSMSGTATLTSTSLRVTRCS